MKPPFPKYIDSTMRATFVSCPHKMFLEYILHYKSRYPSIDLHAGKCYASALEVARRDFYDNGVEPDIALKNGIKTLIEEWGDFDVPEGHVKTLDRMCGALIYYFDTFGWATDYIQPYKVNDKSALEFSFAVPIPDTKHPETGDPIFYTGRTDMLATYNGQLFVEDDKTTKQLGPSWSKNWTHRSQFTGYCWSAQSYDLPVAGAIVRGISILKTKYGHAESIQFRPQWMIDRWLEQLQRDIKKMIQCWEEGYWDYNLDNSCNHYGGCLFMDTCAQQDEQRVLENDFVQRIWNPLEQTETEINK